MSEPKYVSVAEFREMGLLSELNRCFLHPRGLALSVCVEADGTEQFGPIWDCRDDPGGISYGGSLLPMMRENADNANRAAPVKETGRTALFGWVVQPSTWVGDSDG